MLIVDTDAGRAERTALSDGGREDVVLFWLPSLKLLFLGLLLCLFPAFFLLLVVRWSGHEVS